LPDTSASYSAGSSTIPPRAGVDQIGRLFMRFNRAALNMPTVSGVFGQWMLTKSARGQRRIEIGDRLGSPPS